MWREHGRAAAPESKTFFSQIEAERFRMLVEGSGNRWPRGWAPGFEPVQQQVGVTFGEFAERSIASRSRASAATKADYRRDVDRYMGELVDLELRRITVDDVADWLGALGARGLAPKTIANLHGLASGVMRDALARHPPLAEHNPFVSRLPKGSAAARAEEMVFLTTGELQSILRHIPERYEALAVTLALTGLRFGEATAIQPRDIEIFPHEGQAPIGRLTVVRAWKRDDRNQYYLGEPKTPRARRTIALSARVVDVLLPLLAGKRRDDLVFTSPTGRQQLNARFYETAWRPAIARAKACDAHYAGQLAGRGPGRLRQWLPVPCGCVGLLEKTPRIHDLRHSHASHLIAAGVSLYEVSRRLGHESYDTTDRRYSHLLPDDPRDGLRGIIDSALEPPVSIEERRPRS